MEEIKQEIENNISRIKALVREKNKEISILKREISTLENEQWQFEELKDGVKNYTVSGNK